MLQTAVPLVKRKYLLAGGSKMPLQYAVIDPRNSYLLFSDDFNNGVIRSIVKTHASGGSASITTNTGEVYEGSGACKITTSDYVSGGYGGWVTLRQRMPARYYYKYSGFIFKYMFKISEGIPVSARLDTGVSMLPKGVSRSANVVLFFSDGSIYVPNEFTGEKIGELEWETGYSEEVWHELLFIINRRKDSWGLFIDGSAVYSGKLMTVETVPEKDFCVMCGLMYQTMENASHTLLVDDIRFYGMLW